MQNEADDVEFIFINDGSKDNTLNILRELETNDSRVVVIDQNNAGVSVARNKALEVVRGDYIYLLDGDDYLSDDAISEIKRIMQKYHPEIILPAYNVVENNVEKYEAIRLKDGLYSKYDLFEKISIFPTSPQLIYRADIIVNKSIRFNPTIKCGEVYDFTINYMQYVDTIYVLNFPIFNYFQRSDSAVHKLNYNNDLTVVNAVESIYKNGDDLLKFPSFTQTAFHLFKGFIYNKYLKSSTLESEMLYSINYSLSNRTIKRCVKDIIFKSHIFCRNRLLALYMILLPNRFGFKLLRKIYFLKMNMKQISSY